MNLYNAHVSPPAKHSKSPVLYASSFAQLCPTILWPHGLQPSRLLCPCDSAGKNTGVDCHFLLQGIFPTQRQNPHLLSLLHWQAGSSPLSHLGSPLLFYMKLIWILHDKHWISPFFFFFKHNHYVPVPPSDSRISDRIPSWSPSSKQATQSVYMVWSQRWQPWGCQRRSTRNQDHVKQRAESSATHTWRFPVFGNIAKPIFAWKMLLLDFPAHLAMGSLQTTWMHSLTLKGCFTVG